MEKIFSGMVCLGENKQTTRDRFLVGLDAGTPWAALVGNWSPSIRPVDLGAAHPADWSACWG